MPQIGGSRDLRSSAASMVTCFSVQLNGRHASVLDNICEEVDNFFVEVEMVLGGEMSPCESYNMAMRALANRNMTKKDLFRIASRYRALVYDHQAAFSDKEFEEVISLIRFLTSVSQLDAENYGQFAYKQIQEQTGIS